MGRLTDAQWEALDQAIFSATPDALADWLLSSGAGLGERLDAIRWLLDCGHVEVIEVAERGSRPHALKPAEAFRIIEQVAAGSGARRDLAQDFFLKARGSGSSLWRREATARRPARRARVEPWLIDAVSFYRRFGFFESPKSIPRSPTGSCAATMHAFGLSSPARSFSTTHTGTGGTSTATWR